MWPSVFPFNIPDDEDGFAIGNLISMANKDIAPAEIVHRTMACRLECGLIALYDRIAAAVSHVDASVIAVRSFDVPASSDDHPVGALIAETAVVPADKQIVIAVMMEDEGGLNGVISGVNIYFSTFCREGLRKF